MAGTVRPWPSEPRPTPTATPRACCGRTAGARSRTRPPTSLDRLTPGRRPCSTSGCGPGTITIDIARRVAPGRVVGHRRGRRRHRRGTGGRRRRRRRRTSSWPIGDVYALDHADDSFDVVHAHQVLQHLADPVAALREMRRVCRPGGVVAARDGIYRAMSWYPAVARARPLARRVLRRGRGQRRRARRRQPPARTGRSRPASAPWRRQRVRLVLRHRRRAGVVGRPVGRPRRATTSLGDPGRRARARHPGRPRPSMADAWRTWAATPDAWFAVLHGEVLATP